MAENKKPENKGKNRVRDVTNRIRFLESFEGNQLTTSITLESREMQLMYRRFFDGMSRATFLMRFYARVSGIPQAEDKLSKEVSESIDQATTNINHKNEIAVRLLDEIDDLDVKSISAKGRELDVVIIDPLAFKFLKVLIKADEAIKNLNALWLSCTITDEQFRKATSEVSAELRKINGKTRELSFGMRKKVKQQTEVTDINNSSPGNDENNSTELSSETVNLKSDDEAKQIIAESAEA